MTPQDILAYGFARQDELNGPYRLDAEQRPPQRRTAGGLKRPIAACRARLALLAARLGSGWTWRTPAPRPHPGR